MAIRFNVPDDLHQVCHDAVAHALNRKQLPDRMPELCAWLEGDGWDELISGIDEHMAVRMLQMDYLLNDKDMRDYLGLEVATVSRMRRGAGMPGSVSKRSWKAMTV